MSKPTIEEILAPKPEARPCIYAYSIDDKAHKGPSIPGCAFAAFRPMVLEHSRR